MTSSIMFSGVRARRRTGWMPVFAYLVVMAGCSSYVGDGPPRRSSPVEASVPGNLPPAIPGRAGNFSPYRVLGKTYTVLPTAAGYDKTGIASWYGRKFHGRATSNGERYDMFALTAAHRAIPIPTYARITNVENGRSVVVRINDRGPFHDERLIDLSYGAAQVLGFVDQGTAKVRIQTLPLGAQDQDRGTRQAGTSAQRSDGGALAERAFSMDAQSSAAPLYLQAASFRDQNAANLMRQQLMEIVGDAGVLVVSEDGLHRVRIGPFADLPSAERLQALLITADFGVPLLISEPAEGL